MPTSRRHYRISFEEAVAAHDYIVRVFGGLPGIRDRAAIESAVGRPYTGYYRRIESKAAALVQSLALNHGLTDGNKRTAVAIMSLFLDKSGYMLLAKNEQTLNIDVE